MTLKQLTYFVAIVKHQSFRKAAEALYLTPSALTQQIQSLEQELNCVLMLRSPRGFQLTPAGAAFYEKLVPALEQLSQAIKAAQQPDILSGKGITLGYISPPFDLLTRQAVRAFHGDYPQVAIDLFPCELDELAYLLEKGSVDISCISHSYLGSCREVQYTPAGAFHYALVLHREHPLSRRDCLTLEDMRQVEFVCLAEEHNTALFNSYAARHLRDFRTVHVHSISELYAAMRVRQGFGILPSYIFRTRPDLKAFPLYPELTDSFGVAFSRSSRNVSLLLPYLLSEIAAVQFDDFSGRELAKSLFQEVFRP